MPTSCHTHDYDGQLRQKWFEMRPVLLEKYLPNCLSFEDTIQQIQEWLEKKYYNVKRIGRARRSIRILTSERRGNFDSRNDIDVEELLPILWDKVKNQEDIHDTFYEQLCDITGGSCSQGRSTRLFQFLFLFDLPTNTESSTEQQSDKKDDENTPSISQEQKSNIEEKTELSTDQQLETKDDQNIRLAPQEEQSNIEEKTELSTEQESEKNDDENIRSIAQEQQPPSEEHIELSSEQASDTKDDENTRLTSQEPQESISHEEKQSHLEEKIGEKQQSHQMEQNN